MGQRVGSGTGRRSRSGVRRVAVGAGQRAWSARSSRHTAGADLGSPESAESRARRTQERTRPGSATDEAGVTARTDYARVLPRGLGHERLGGRASGWDGEGGQKFRAHGPASSAGVGCTGRAGDPHGCAQTLAAHRGEGLSRVIAIVGSENTRLRPFAGVAAGPQAKRWLGRELTRGSLSWRADVVDAPLRGGGVGVPSGTRVVMMTRYSLVTRPAWSCSAVHV